MENNNKEQEIDAIKFLKWISEFNVGNPYYTEKIILVDGNWYWENDYDGDGRLTEDHLYEMFEKQQSNDKIIAEPLEESFSNANSHVKKICDYCGESEDDGHAGWCPENITK